MSDQTIWNNSSRVSYQDLDETVEAFEECWNLRGIAQLECFLPPPEHPEFESLSLELLCVDLERRWNSGNAKSINDYYREFHELFAHPRVLERVAFEEYRLRVQNGEPIEPIEYARRFKLKTDHWSRSKGDGSSDSGASEAFAGGIAHEMQRIAGVTHRFPHVGERFLDFDLVERLGNCNRDHVYLARQCTLANRLVVVKFTTEMWRESERMARLQHTNVVPVYSVHQRDGLQAVCMPYLGRHTLASLLRSLPDRRSFTGSDYINSLVQDRVNQTDDKSSQMPDELVRELRTLDFERICVWIVSRIAKGLSHAHVRGLLHRDLKPSNILITDEGQPMILDFNLSEEAFPGSGKSLMVGGTLPYMSPEHVRAFRSEGSVDVRSDIYSLGIILFQLLTGDFPVHMHGGSIIAKLDMLANQPASTVPSVRGVNPRLTHAVGSIVQRCLSPDPNRRYQSAKELQDDLGRHLGNLPLRHAPNRSKLEVVRKWCCRHPRLTSASAMSVAALIFLVIVTGWIVARERAYAHGDARDVFRQFEQNARVARASLSLPIAEEVRQNGLEAAEHALALYQVESPAWRLGRNFRYLDEANQQSVRRQLGELHFLMSEAKFNKAIRNQESASVERILRQSLYHNQLSRLANAASSASFCQLAAIQLHLGNRSEATRASELASRLPVDQAHERYTMAVQYASNQRYASAISLLTDLLEEDPRSFFSWFLLGNCHCTIENFADAEVCYSTATALWPEFYACYFHRGICRLRAGQCADADRDFTKVLRLKPRHTSTLINRAMARTELGRFQDAVDDLSLAIDNGRDDSLVYMLRSRAWTGMGCGDEAKADRITAIERKPVDVEGWLQRGLARLPDDPKLALADIESALRLEPNAKKALQNKAYVLSHCLNDDVSAIETLSQLLQLEPKDATTLVARGLMRARIGQDELAIRDGRDALQLTRSAGCYYQVAGIFAQSSMRDNSHASEAMRMLRTAVKHDLQWARLAADDLDLAPIASRADFRQLLDAAADLGGNTN